MNKKMQYLIEHSLKNKFKSKSFIISNIVILLSLFVIVNIDTIINFFGGDFLDKHKIYIIDDAGSREDFDIVLKSGYDVVFDSNNYIITDTDKSLEDLKKEIKEDENKDIVIHIYKENDEYKSEIISYEFIDTMFYNSIVNILNQTKYSIALKNSTISPEELASISSPIEVNRLVLNEDLDEKEELLKTMTSVVIPILILPFFMLILLIVSMIGAEVNEEKTSKSMEIIISSVSPKLHFAAKIVSVNIFVIAQSLLLVLYGVLAVVLRLAVSGVPEMTSVMGSGEVINYVDLFLNSDLFHGILKAIPFILVIFLLSFIAFSLVAGILASMTTSIEDYQQIQTPLSLVMIAGYYLAMFASFYESSVFIKVVSYIPLMSAIISPALLLLGQYTIMDMCISIILLLATIFILIRYGSRVYKVGILNYSSNKLWKKMFKAIKEK